MKNERRQAVPTPTDQVVSTTPTATKELLQRRQQAAQARRRASEMGDYASAESWFRQEQALAAKISTANSEAHS